MTNWLRCLLAAVLAVGLQRAPAQSTPEGALEELATATKPQDLLKHLPAAVEELVNRLPADDKAATLRKLSLDKGLASFNMKLCKKEDGRWEITGPDGSTGILESKGAFVSGVDALVPLEIKQEVGSVRQLYIVRMHFEQEEWRVIEFAPWIGTELESQLVEKLDPVAINETRVVESMHQIVNALFNYGRIFPQLGFPPTLSVLCGAPDESKPESAEAGDGEHLGDSESPDDSEQEIAPERARLLQDAFCREPLLLNGYEFRYTMLDSGGGAEKLEEFWNVGMFQLTANAVEFGKTGYRNYFFDNRHGLRFTTESRAANESDETVRGRH